MENLIILIVVVLFLLLLLSGQYISSILLTVGLLGIFLLDGMEMLGGYLQSDPFYRVASYSLTTIPLYVLMAQFVLQAGIVQDFYNLVFKISKGKSGLLGTLTILLGGLLGAVSGSGTATAASLGQVAVPELKKRGYTEELAGSIAASAGSLSGIIPPSIIIILYGVMTQQSIGELFIAAFIPGILVMFVFIVCALVALKMSQKKQGNVTLQETEEIKTTLGRYILVVLLGVLIIGSIFGGIYTGVFTPTEAGAVGSFISLLAAFIMGKVNKQFFKSSILETLKVSVMTLFIMIGAALFGRFISLSLLPRKIIESLGPLVDQPVILLIIIIAIYFLLFMFLEGAAVIVMTVPILMPLIIAMEVDVIWFGILLSMICTLGLLTPPVGLSVYAVAGVTKIPMEKLFRTSMVFAAIACVIVGGLMIIFPEIVTWLPGTMKQ